MINFISPEYLLPIIAIIVSIFSLGYSVYESRKTFRLTQTHNKKSVEPIITTIYNRLEASDYPNCAEESFEVINCGFGPALIKSFQLIWKDKTYKNIYELYIEYIKEPKYMSGVSRILFLGSTVIASNQSLSIFKLYFPKTVPFKVDYFEAINFHNLATEVGLKIEFETLYGEKRIFELSRITD